MPSFGVVTHALGHHPIPFDVCLRQIARTGGEHILLLTSPDGPVIHSTQLEDVPSQFPNVLASDPDELNRRVDAAGLRIGGLAAGVHPDVSSDEAAAQSLAALEPYRDCAIRLDCPAFTIGTPRAEAPGLPLTAKAMRIRRLAQLMDKLVAGQGEHLTVSLDVHYHSIVETLDDCRHLVELCQEPQAGLLLNIGHLTTARQQGWRLIEEYPDRIHVVGWKDHSLAADRPSPTYSIELGTGDSPFHHYIHAFKRAGIGPVHLVNVEHPPRGTEVETMRRSIAYLRRLWEEVD